MNNRKCLVCGLVNFANADLCPRCGAGLNKDDALDSEDDSAQRSSSFFKRALITLVVAFCAVLALHASLLLTSEAITAEQRQTVLRSVRVLEARGFSNEAWLLRHVVSFRQNDNWWNATVGHADAYAATNFPFEIVTLYPDFFTAPADDTERAAILLHEVQHLRGAGEEKAFAEVWQNRVRLGWTEEEYQGTRVWHGTEELTREHAPHLFDCAVGAVCAD